HGGVYAFPDTIFATQDGNEMTNPITPFVRAIDAFDPEDWSFSAMVRHGITTIQVLPGSGNLIGGQGQIFKLRLLKNRQRTVEDLLFKGPDIPSIILKMACGENPKRVYGTG